MILIGEGYHVKAQKKLIQDWDELVDLIPDDLEASAKEHQALLRQREIKSASDLLRLILIYAVVLSLRTTAVWAVGLGVCDVSRQDLDKRVLKSTAWLRHVLSVLLNTLLSVPPAGKGLIHRLILRDASTISRPSSPGTEWRIHLSWCPFSQQPAQVTLSDDRQGEGLDDAGLQANDLLIADRAYGIWRTVQVALEALAYFIIRLPWSTLPLQTLDDQRFDLIAWLRNLPDEQEQAENSVIATNDPQRRVLRLIVGRLPPDKAEEARERVRREARKKKQTPHPNTLLAAGFCILLTNLPATAWPSLSVLALYRVRWQVEWCFRRWKSLCCLDVLPAYPAKIAEPVLLAKLIIILLMQQRLGTLPWNDWWVAEQPALVVSTLVKAVHNRLCNIICPSAIIDQLLQNPTPFLRHLRSSRRKRPLQLAQATHRFASKLEGIVSAPLIC